MNLRSVFLGGGLLLLFFFLNKCSFRILCKVFPPWEDLRRTNRPSGDRRGLPSCSIFCKTILKSDMKKTPVFSLTGTKRQNLKTPPPSHHPHHPQSSPFSSPQNLAYGYHCLGAQSTLGGGVREREVRAAQQEGSSLPTSATWDGRAPTAGRR